MSDLDVTQSSESAQSNADVPPQVARANIREAAIAAAKAARESAETPAKASPAPVVEEAKAEDETPSEEAPKAVEEEKKPSAGSRLNQLLKERARAQAEREQKDSFRAQVEALQRELAELKQARTATQPQEDFKTLFMQNPTAALQRYGLSWEEMGQAAAKEGTPENLVKSVQQQLEARMQAELEKRDRQLEEERKWREQLQQREQQEAIARSHRQFVSLAMSEKFPNIAHLYDGEPERLIEEAYKLQHRAALKNIEATQEDLAEALEEIARDKLNKIRAKFQSTTTAGATVQGATTLGNSTAATRATGPVSEDKLTPKQRVELAKQKAAALMREQKLK